ncbi:hypothetical protein DPMN_020734 [Dreissena polymorpha]|uniref:Uncharacterized protein n=1 Tax=Dreissena polymorpha TaxID=45954 RepID=A0A9D4NHB1_DREPO|nr:hypothetical protein DPMN_020734 [Dreissena polymorpha]
MSDIKKTSKPRVCPLCLSDKGIKKCHVCLNDHLRTQHRLSTAELPQITSAAKAAKCQGKSARNNRCYWRCPCGSYMIKRGQHLTSSAHGLVKDSEEFFAKYAAFVKAGVSACLFQVCYTNYMTTQ